MTRTDIHRPSAIDPTAYVAVGPWCEKVEGADAQYLAVINEDNRRHIEADMARTGGQWANHDHGGTCHICGAWAQYLMVFRHLPTNTYIMTGFDCAFKMELAHDIDPDAFKARMKAAWGSIAGRIKARETLESLGLTRALELAEVFSPPSRIEQDHGWVKNPDAWPDGKVHVYYVIRDLVRKLVAHGSLSEKQVNYLRSLIQQADTWDEREAQRQAEHDAAKDAPTGRVVVSGEILSTKVQESQFGMTEKMLVKTTDGWKLWCTVPAALDSTERGTKVTLKVTVEPSNDDPKFAFGKRPTLWAGGK